MKQYNHLLFDLDDTILDFQATQFRAINRIIKVYAPQIDEEIFNTTYNEINHHLWAKYENGEIMKNDIITKRFALTFEKLAIDADGQLAAKDYQKFLSEGYDLLPHAIETLKQVKQAGYCLYVVSNGELHTQMSRLAGAKLTHYFDAVYISEQTGSQKPNKKFFEYVFANSPEIEKSKALMIGDSITSDIQGAKNSGLDSCWFNVFETKQKSNATFEVMNHKQLQKLLLEQEITIQTKSFSI
ncbi:MAG: YjjG family noncanonical pyrimidine nucleotidase [Kurthia sp.]|nr:YjjG family noncanonical pyrimidine nucleotidase [Candidatus Kurthia equi]